jgi:hypothetical protein
MADIDKRLEPNDVQVEDGEALEIEFPGEEELEGVTEEAQADGSVVVDFEAQRPAAETDSLDHGVNLSEHLDETTLTLMASRLIEKFEDDLRTREPWEKAYQQGLTLLGLKIEDRQEPWAGASGVFHPILIEAIIKFQADAMMETMPAQGPVMTKVVGKSTPERDKQAQRVRHDMNYYCTEVMTEYRGEHEQMLFNVGLAGAVFKKTYQDTVRNRPTSKFIKADDLVVSYGTTDLITCPCITHRIRMFPNDLKKAQYTGQYRDIELPKPTINYTKTDKIEDKASGDAPQADKDDRHELLEFHTEYDIPGFEHTDEETGEITGLSLPYVITVERYSRKVIGLYRNWEEDGDPLIKNEFFTHYPYLPGPGFYGIGLIHLLGGIAKTATSILRQLIDAGSLANLPAGLKSRGLRIKGDNSPLRPGELRDVDVPGGSVKDNVHFAPFKEPSTVLYNLLGTVVEEGRGIVSIADIKVGDMSSQAPVGTTLALLERGMKVMTGVQARIHAAMRLEFKLLAKLIKEHGPEEYEYEVEQGATRAEDYDGRVDVLPVSNPNASTMAHRIMLGQAVHQLSTTAPQIYDLKELHRDFLVNMGKENVDKIIPSHKDMKPMDPVAENIAIMTSKPVKAFVHQDQESHIRVHMAAMQDPKIQKIMQMSPMADAIGAAAAAHIQEHVAFQYRRGIEKELGVPLPEHGAPLPEDTEVQLSKLVADAADKLLNRDQAEAQAMKNAEAQNDPVLQQQRQEAETKSREVDRKADADQMRRETSLAQIQSRSQTDAAKLDQDARLALIDKEIELRRLDVELARIAAQDSQMANRVDLEAGIAEADDEIEKERIASQERMEHIRSQTARQNANNNNSNDDQDTNNSE